MSGRFPVWWAVMLLVWLVALPIDAQTSRHTSDWSDGDDPLESDDDDLLTTARTPPPAPRNRTILLDINPVDMDPKVMGRIYARALDVMKGAQDLGTVYGREALGEGQLYQHVVRTCQDIENVPCIARFAARTEATLAVFGQISDLDDIYLLELHLLDLRSTRVRESVRVTIPKPATDQELIENTAQATCRLVRHYGCKAASRAAALAAPAVVPATAPGPAAPRAPAQAPDSPAQASDDDDDTPPPAAAPASTRVSNPEVLDWDDEDLDDEPPARATSAARPQSPAGKGPRSPRSARQKTLSNTGWAFIALSAASLAGGATTTALMFQAKSDYDAAQPGEGAKARDARDRALMMQWTSLGLYSAAGAFAAVGIPLLVLGYQDSPDQTVLLPSAAPDGVGLVLTTRF